MKLSSIHVYPVKGARGIALDRADVLFGGLRHDRRFMVVTDDGMFITQREHPRLALVTTAIEGDALILGAAGSIVRLPVAPEGRGRRHVHVWHDAVEAVEVHGDAAGALSEHLGVKCQLVFMPVDVIRPVDPRFSNAGDRVGFADGFPVLLAASASLDELNGRLEVPISMNRFRPNLVVGGGDAFEEDRHDEAWVGDLRFRMPKRCARCPVTTIDQLTAEVSREPLRTLSRYRRIANNVYFAQNLIPDREGAVTVGDAIRYEGRS